MLIPCSECGKSFPRDSMILRGKTSSSPPGPVVRTYWLCPVCLETLEKELRDVPVTPEHVAALVRANRSLADGIETLENERAALREKLDAVLTDLKALKEDVGVAASYLNVAGPLSHRVQMYKQHYSTLIEQAENRAKDAESKIAQALIRSLQGCLANYLSVTSELGGARPIGDLYDEIAAAFETTLRKLKCPEEQERLKRLEKLTGDIINRKMQRECDLLHEAAVLALPYLKALLPGTGSHTFNRGEIEAAVSAIEKGLAAADDYSDGGEDDAR